MQNYLKRLSCVAALALPCLLLAGAPAGAQPAPGGPPGAGGRPAGGAAPRPPAKPPSKTPADAAAGTYKLDTSHASVFLRIMHQGTSYSTFRFGDVTGTLAWNPASVETSKVDIIVGTKSIATPVAGFADRLTGERYLNVAAFPQAEFVSTSIRRTGPTTGEITGNLTFMGQTHPITVQAQLVGIGQNMRGGTTMGFEGTTKFKRSDFGFTVMLPDIGDEADLILDFSFDRQG
jgi:polyisoprenoid-binding protein YceI